MISLCKYTLMHIDKFETIFFLKKLILLFSKGALDDQK